MLRFSFLATAFVAVFVSSFSQNIPPVLKGPPYKQGIYRTFTEFLNNAPSIEDKFTVKPYKNVLRMKGVEDALNIKVVERYRLQFTDTTVSNRYAKSFWGFSLGDSIFVNTGNYQPGEGYPYRLMKEVNRYSYWVDQVSNGPRSNMGSGPMQVNTPQTTTSPVGVMTLPGSGAAFIGNTSMIVGVVLNINNGNFYFLNKQTMYSILANDAQLLNQYKEASGKGKIDVMFSFLSRYNAAHRNEIGRVEKDASIVLFRRMKKERADTVAVATTDSISYVVGPGQSTRFHFTQLNVTLCAGASCKDFALSNSVTNYIQCTYQENDPQPKLELVEPRVAEFYLREIEGAKERGKR
jgi:hypothetical protein